MDEDKRERFQLWQRKTMDQFIQVTNTLLLIASALLGYLVSFRTNNNLKTTYWLMNLPIIITTLIIVLLVFLSYNRLKEFRLTQSQIINKDISDEKIRKIGNNNWKLLKALLLLFSIDIIVFVFVILYY